MRVNFILPPERRCGGKLTSNQPRTFFDILLVLINPSSYIVINYFITLFSFSISKSPNNLIN